MAAAAGDLLYQTEVKHLREEVRDSMKANIAAVEPPGGRSCEEGRKHLLR